MEEISALAAAETVEILNHTDATMVAQLPITLIASFMNKAKEYDGKVELKENVSLNEQNLSEETRALLLILYREFWCDSEEEKELLDSNLIRSEKEFNEAESKRLDPFKDSKKEYINSEVQTSELSTDSAEQSEESITALMEVPKKWYVRIFNRIIRFFRKK